MCLDQIMGTGHRCRVSHLPYLCFKTNTSQISLKLKKNMQIKEKQAEKHENFKLVSNTQIKNN